MPYRGSGAIFFLYMRRIKKRQVMTEAIAELEKALRIILIKYVVIDVIELSKMEGTPTL